MQHFISPKPAARGRGIGSVMASLLDTGERACCQEGKVGVHHAKFLSPIDMMQGNAYRMAAIIASSCRITYQALQQILVEAESSCEESSVENGEERSCSVEVQRSCQPSAAGLLHAAATQLTGLRISRLDAVADPWVLSRGAPGVMSACWLERICKVIFHNDFTVPGIFRCLPIIIRCICWRLAACSTTHR